MTDFEKCVKEQKLVKFEASEEMIRKELAEAENDLKSANTSLNAKTINGPRSRHTIACSMPQRHWCSRKVIARKAIAV